jgi:hypothetical protein
MKSHTRHGCNLRRSFSLRPPAPPPDRCPEIRSGHRDHDSRQGLICARSAMPVSGTLGAHFTLDGKVYEVHLAPLDRFRICHPAPVRWNADGPRHKAGELIPPSNSSQGQMVLPLQRQAVRARHRAMLETVGWIKRRKNNKKAKGETAAASLQTT